MTQITDLNPDAQWCLMTFRSLKVGGVWGVPRSGLIFTRTGEDTLALTDRMPFMDGMEERLTPAQLDEQQDGDYLAIKQHMTEAGITVTDETKEQI